MDEEPATPPLSSAALIGWGMAVLALGVAALVHNVRSHLDGESSWPIVLSGFICAVGWGLLGAGVTLLARRVDQLSHDRQRATTSPL